MVLRSWCRSVALPCQPKTAVTNATTYGKLLFCLFQREHTARKSSKPTAYGKVLKRKKLTLVRKPHVPVILISFGRSEKLCSKFCLRLASMANIINAIFKEMRVLCGMRLSQVLGTNLFGQTFFSIIAALPLERGDARFVSTCVN